jgi:hypothetical protein
VVVDLLTRKGSEMTTNKPASTTPVLVRLPRETYAALQLSLPFVQRSSVQDVLTAFIDDYLAHLAESDSGFAQALQGLRESEARRDGVLARRAVRKGRMPA